MSKLQTIIMAAGALAILLLAVVGAPAVRASPEQITGLVLWLSGADMADGPVAVWPNRGASVAAAQPDAAQQPVAADGVVEFDGLDDYLSAPISYDGGALTLFVLLIIPTDISSGIQRGIAGSGGSWQLREVERGAGAFYNYSAAGLRGFTFELPYDDRPHLLTVRYNPAMTIEVGLWLDGALAETRSQALGALLANRGAIEVGRSFGGEYMLGGLRDLLVYDRALTDAERAEVEAFLLAAPASVSPTTKPVSTALSTSTRTSTAIPTATRTPSRTPTSDGTPRPDPTQVIPPTETPVVPPVGVRARPIDAWAYGAQTHDGRDDSTQLQAAIDAAYNNSYKVVNLDAGVYDLNKPIFVRNGVMLRGADPFATIFSALPTFAFTSTNSAMIRQMTVYNGPVVYDNTAMGKIILKDIRLNCNKVPGSNGILASLQQPAVWTNVRVDNCIGYGIALVDGQQAVLKNIELIDNGVGLEIKGQQFAWIEDLNVERWNKAAVWIHKGQYCPLSPRISNGHFEQGGANVRADSVVLLLECQQNGLYENIFASGSQFDLFRVAAQPTLEERAQVYTISQARIGGNATLITELRDLGRGVVLGYEQTKNMIPLLVAGNENYRIAPQGLIVPGLDGEVNRFGAAGLGYLTPTPGP